MFPWFIWKRSKISRFQKPLNTLSVCTFCSHAYFFEGRLRSLLLHDFWIHADFWNSIWMHYSWFLKPILQLRTTTRMNNQESLTPFGSSWAAVLTMSSCSNWILTTPEITSQWCVMPLSFRTMAMKQLLILPAEISMRQCISCDHSSQFDSIGIMTIYVHVHSIEKLYVCRHRFVVGICWFHKCEYNNGLRQITFCLLF